MSSPSQPSEANTELKLANLLTERTVQAQASAGDWEAAADLAGALLVGNGSVEPSYVPAMKRVLREMGPYAVIAPGIVLLHARPEDGVREPCLALVTLATPVRFGHSENDPVDLVFALGARDKKAHISALQQLARLLGNEAALQAVHAAQDGPALLSAITRYAG
jgi:PTS system ascorbate-specific IIA component